MSKFKIAVCVGSHTHKSEKKIAAIEQCLICEEPIYLLGEPRLGGTDTETLNVDDFKDTKKRYIGDTCFKDLVTIGMKDALRQIT